MVDVLYPPSQGDEGEDDLTNSKEEIDQIYARLSPRADKLYRFVMLYANYLKEPRDYGTGQLVTMTEVHTLTLIEDNPGYTVSDLAKWWGCTKSAVSQTIKRLEARGLVYKVRDENNAKILHLYPTEEGVKLSTAHKLFDNMDIMQTSNDLLRSCTAEDIDTFYKVIDAYCELF